MRYVLEESLINEMLTALGELPFARVGELINKVHTQSLEFVEVKAPETEEAIDVEFTEVQPPAAQG